MIFLNFLMGVKKAIVEIFYPKITGKQLERLLIRNNRSYYGNRLHLYRIITYSYSISIQTETSCYGVMPLHISVELSKKGSKYMISDDGLLETEGCDGRQGSYIYCYFTKNPKNLMMYIDKMVGFIIWKKTGPRKRHDLGAYEDVKLIKQ